MCKIQAFMMNVKETRNRIFGMGVEKKIYGIFRSSSTFSHSHQSFNNFYNDVLAQQ